jgi:uncharacterized protein
MEALNQDTLPPSAFEVTYNNKSMTNDIAAYVLSICYVDNLDGVADQLDIDLEDTDGRWLDAWYPEKGAELTLKFGYLGSPLISAGSFCIDEIELSDSPSLVRIRATATGVLTAVRTRRSKAFNDTTLPAIVATIAKRNNMTVIGKIESYKLDRITQYGETDLVFLSRIAKQFGYVFKCTDNNKKLVFWKQADLMSAKVSRTIRISDCKSWRGCDTISDVPGKVSVRHHDPKTKKLTVYGVEGDKSTVVSQANAGKSHNADEIKINARATTQASGSAMAQAELDRRHLARTSLSLQVIGDATLAAGQVIGMDGFGRLSGNFLIESVRHQISRSAGYTCDLDCKRVAPPIKGKIGKPSAAKPKLKIFGPE